MKNDDYIELIDLKEIIQDGDEITFKDSPWRPVTPGLIGTQVGEHPSGFRFRRHRSTVIRDAAIELLRKIYDCTATPLVPIHTIANDAWNLKEALGLTIEELRGEG